METMIKTEETEVSTHDALFERAALVIEEHGWTQTELCLLDGSVSEDENEYELSVLDNRIIGYCALGALWRAEAERGLIPPTAGAAMSLFGESLYETIGAKVGLSDHEASALYVYNDHQARSAQDVTAMLRSMKSGA